ncbi:uncharacterized protein PRCAT00004073001 [Priceomyces carsonii]|uniref:uncharacterized protein n=1 Tax=Priceomyces carsonii TaxID=28549 RepID=UPI002ED9A724|nr:unnamed protein product [Priceomyces carsonii]
MFEGCSFLVISSEPFNSDDEIKRVTRTIEDNGGKVFRKEEHDNSQNYLSDNVSSVIHHIVTRSVDFIEYNTAKKCMVPITSPEWVFESVKEGKPLNPKKFNPDPKYFMKDCFICVADNLPVGDKEAIYGGVQAFGGQFFDELTRYTTHLIAVDLSNEKSIIALSATGQSNGVDDIDIKIVSPSWIDDCLKFGRKLSETSYLMSKSKIGDSSQNEQMVSPSTPNHFIQESQEVPPNHFDSNFFQGKSVYIKSDYKLSERLFNAVKTLIERHGGKILNNFDEEEVDIYIGQYRAGEQYVKSCKSNRIIVANLQWLYSIIVTNKWVLPLNSNFLHYPIPPEPLPNFKKLRISVTNYSGDARTYLSMLITILGGTFTKTLTKENDYLIAAKPTGKKYEAATNKWANRAGGTNVKVVNHIWLEECFANWKLLDHNEPHFQYLGNGEGVETLLGKTKLDEQVLKSWYTKSMVETTEGDVDDSCSEPETRQLINELTSQAKANTRIIPAEEEDFPQSFTKSFSEKETPPLLPSPKDKIISNATKDDESPPLEQRLGGRSAAKKAAEKLHSDMADLNNYKELSRSARKMKSYMEELENSLTPKKRRSSLPEDETETVETPEPFKKKTRPTKSTNSDFQIIAVMTGCEQVLTLSKPDSAKLAKAGIKVLTDLSEKYDINTLVAPRILRTEKFLRSLSKVDKIIHPNYLSDILSKGNLDTWSWDSISKEFNINDYSLDKVIATKELNAELGIAANAKNGFSNLLKGKKKGELFKDMKFNLSTNLNGGVEVISRILSSQGAIEMRPVKTINASNIKSLLQSVDGIKIVIANKSKDTKLINNFKKIEPEGMIIDWDWCVKSIFKMKLEKLEDFIL